MTIMKHQKSNSYIKFYLKFSSYKQAQFIHSDTVQNLHPFYDLFNNTAFLGHAFLKDRKL